MIVLELFLTFLEIGAVSFGGGYGMISLLSEKVTAHGWMTETEFLNFVAVAESTPGPIAINMATFVGAGQAGFFGALAATFGVVLPAFLIILLVCIVARKLLSRRGVAAFLGGVRPSVVGLIIATGLVMLLKNIFGLAGGDSSFDPIGLALFAGVCLVAFLLRVLLRKKPSPILLLGISAVAGVAVGYILY